MMAPVRLTVVLEPSREENWRSAVPAVFQLAALVQRLSVPAPVLVAAALAEIAESRNAPGAASAAAANSAARAKWARRTGAAVVCIGSMGVVGAVSVRGGFMRGDRLSFTRKG
jgi:agmatine/peptidylarginine deiminase